MTDVCLRLFICRPDDLGSAQQQQLYPVIICNAVSEEAIFHAPTFHFKLVCTKETLFTREENA